MTSRTRSMAGVVLATFVAAPGAANVAELVRGRCHMGTCSWFSVEESFVRFARRFGYSTQNDAPQRGPITVPEDILRP